MLKEVKENRKLLNKLIKMADEAIVNTPVEPTPENANVPIETTELTGTSSQPTAPTE